MARKIIVLESNTGTRRFMVAFWADVPAARQPFYANDTATSAVKDATPEELAALRSGAVVERVLPDLTLSVGTIAAIKAELIRLFQDYQDAVTARNDWARYGTSWDGSAWTDVTVA